MSEYQYYEFRAIDRPLSETEMDDLHDLSSRAEITSTSLSNTYNYGDFRGSPEKLMDRYFDAFVYVANWGTRRLMFRIPRQFFDPQTASAYLDKENGLSLKTGKKHVVLEFLSEDEEGSGWEDGEPWMPSLVSLRSDLMRGDLRALYLGWLATLEAPYWEGDVEQLEPSVPPGLAKLSAPLKSLAEFLRIDDALIEAASAASTGEPPSEPSRDDLARWVQKLPAADKNDYLVRFLAEEGDLHLRAEMSRRFREASAPSASQTTPKTDRRTIAQLLAARDAVIEKRQQKATRQQARLDRQKTQSRARYLDNLALREPSTWQEVESLIESRQQSSYDQAVSLLVDLRELANRSGRSDEFEAQARDLRKQHAQKSSLIRRLNLRNLGG